MGEAFRLGGWGMYPTAIAGLVLLAAAVQYARSPEPRRMHLVRCLSVLTALVGALGFVAGVIKTLLGAAQGAGGDPRELAGWVVQGVGESLNCIGLTIGMLVMSWLAASVGAYRAGGRRAGGAELADPHTH